VTYSFEYFYAFLGCLRAGAIACPVYPIDPSKMELALTKFKLVVEDTGAKLVLTDKLINRVRIGAQVSPA
jgi:acyl-CoA synthetase (AMP-forming)/AMP-acid ligase II